MTAKGPLGAPIEVERLPFAPLILGDCSVRFFKEATAGASFKYDLVPVQAS